MTIVDNLQRSLPAPLPLGVIGTVLLALGSFGAGATRNRGGVMEALGWDWLTYGHGAAIMNVLFTTGLVLLVLAWALLGRSFVGKNSSPDAEHAVKRHLIAWIVPLVAAAPMMSRDVYSYLMQGAMHRDGFDPYTEGAAVNPGPYLLEVSHDWRNTTTPYGPLHLWMGEGVTTLVGDNVAAGLIVYKLISVLGFAAIAWAVPKITRHLGGDPALALWLGVANPVMIIHMIGGMHNESVMVGLVSVGLVACTRRRFILGTALIAVAVSLKATAAIALPFVVWMAVHHYAGHSPTVTRRVATFLVTATIGVAITLATVGLITWLSGSSWGWLSEISGNSKVINPLAGPTLLTEFLVPFIQLFAPNFDYNIVLNAVRPIGSVLMLVGLVVTWWVFRRSERAAFAGIVVAYLAAFIFNSVTLPWYYASVISLAGTFHRNRRIAQVTTLISIFIAFAFTGGGGHLLYHTPWLLITAGVAWVLTDSIFPVGQRAIVPAAPHEDVDKQKQATEPVPARGE